MTLDELNRCSAADFIAALHGVYEHSPWVAQRAASRRPFADMAALQAALSECVATATPAEQLALIRAHPELAGRAAIANELTPESRSEQARAGLDQCSPAEFTRLQELNARYSAKFGFPFIIAVRGTDATGLSRGEVIDHFARRLQQDAATEIRENMQQIERIAAWRLADFLH